MPLESLRETARNMQKTTHVYKTVANDPPFTGTTQVHADVYRPDDDQPRPVLVFIHGGAMVNLSRAALRGNVLALAQEHGLVLVSIDYRLGPEVKVPGIVEDVRDAIEWVYEQGPTLFGADTSRVVVSGSSAGGCLALQSGTFARKPNAIVSLWGYGSVRNAWYTQPTPPYSERPIDRDAALAEVGHRVLTGTGGDTGVALRKSYYPWMRYHGIWTGEMTGFDPVTQGEQIAPYCTIENLTPDYPPTMLLHGELDSDVPVTESIEMAAALEKVGVEHELIVVPQAGHGLGGLSDAEKQVHFDKAWAFARKYLVDESPNA